MRKIALLVALLGLAAGAARAADPAEGDWLVQDRDAKVRIAPCAAAPSRLCGTIFWLKTPLDETGKPKHDAHNPNPALEPRPIIGLTMIRDFQAKAPGRWEGGTIYDPKTGKTYKSKMHVDGERTLKVAGCVAFICQTQTWTR